MAILKVARLGHPVLRQEALPLTPDELAQPATQRLIDDMIETMREYDGAGLAANQVHTLKQICVIEVQANPRYPDAPHIPLMVLVNPVVTPLAEEMEEGWEGCLSVPDMRGAVPRYTSVRLECLDRSGQKIDLIAKDFFARVIQHETDHLRGIVYVDRIVNMASFSFIAEWQRYALGIREQQD
ncbi:MAG TPA: peptide deformylase [Terriglobales bacterium]|nr:peptide deformylase [Terriglobales bacterium]